MERAGEAWQAAKNIGALRRFGKLEVLHIECEKCSGRERLRLDRLIDRYGIDAKLFDWLDEITANCPRKQA